MSHRDWGQYTKLLYRPTEFAVTIAVTLATEPVLRADPGYRHPLDAVWTPLRLPGGALGPIQTIYHDRHNP
jgi:hypothetical protein